MHLDFSKKLILFLFFCTSLFFQTINAQKEYTDHKPVYRKWQDNYIIDKIEYTKTETIFYFRFVCRSGQMISAIFFPPGGLHPWYLKAHGSRQSFDLKAIKNIRRNSVLLKKTLHRKTEYPSLDGFGYTVFSCEVHFDRLPNDIQVVSLIEGKGKEFDQNHFNCFEINLKTWNDKTLGDVRDSEDNVRKFERKFGVNTKPNVKPKPRIKPNTKPKKENPIAKVDPPKVDPPKVDPPKVDPPKVDPPKVDPPKVDPPKVDPKPSANVTRVSRKEDIECDKKMILDKVEFHDGTTDFKGMVQCKQTLFAVLGYMKEHPNSKAVVIGHTDVFGPKKRNMELSKRRAHKVQRWLSMMGITPSRISIEYYGPEQPLVAEGDASNRRVEMKIYCN